MKKLFEIAKAYIPARHMISALALIVIAGVAFAQNVVNYTEQGGAVTKIGGTLDVISGGLFKIAGTTVSSSAAELNYLDITTLGTGAASKALVLDASGDYTFPATATIVMPSSGTMTYNSGSTLTLNTALTANADIVGDGGDQLNGFLQNQITSTTTTLTAAQCGSTIVSDSADVVTLPEASTVLGCRYTFVCGTADDLDVNPNDATDVLGIAGSITGANTTTTIAGAAGDAYRCTDVGAGFALEATGANLWAVLHTNGIITDVN